MKKEIFISLIATIVLHSFWYNVIFKSTFAWEPGQITVLIILFASCWSAIFAGLMILNIPKSKSKQ